MKALQSILDTSGFPARWNCGDWTSLHGWTHIVADLVTFGAYFAIPTVLMLFMMRRNVVYPRAFVLFGLLFLGCGTVHLVEATLFWNPWYRLSAVVKVVTALLSWTSVVVLIRILPGAMRLPELAAQSEELERENDERRQMEEELRQRNEELDGFAYIASHDLKAPLRAIDMLSQWVEEDSGDVLSEKSRGHMTTLRQRVKRLEGLLDDLLEYSRAGRNNVEPEPVCVKDLVRGILEMAPPPTGFEVVIADDVPDALTARGPLEQVFRNLIGNSIKHHDRDTGRIVIAGQRSGALVEFSVEDDGPGIPAKFHEKVFGMFQTLLPRDEVEGSGMGLAIIKKLVEQHGGEVRIESPGERGARFVFTWLASAPVPVAQSV